MAETMTKKELEEFILLSLNLALGLDHSSSYTNSFDIKVTEKGILFIPRMPSTFILDQDLFQKIFKILSATLYPQYSLVKENNVYFVELNTTDIHLQRAFFFRMFKGISRRLIIPDIRQHVSKNVDNKIQLMSNVTLDYDKCAMLAIAGQSGSGKSYFLEYLLWNLKPISDLVIIDPKLAEPAIWAKENGIKFISPADNRSKSDFVAQASQVLAETLQIIKSRQHEMFEKGTPASTYRHRTIVIDEVSALTLDIPKSVRDSFHALLSEIALLGRSSRCHAVLVSQRLDSATISTGVREQCNFIFQVGAINSRTTQFLFPDFNVDGVVIPKAGEDGVGIFQLIDNDPNHVNNVQPFQAPTFFK